MVLHIYLIWGLWCLQHGILWTTYACLSEVFRMKSFYQWPHNFKHSSSSMISIDYAFHSLFYSLAHSVARWWKVEQNLLFYLLDIDKLISPWLRLLESVISRIARHVMCQFGVIFFVIRQSYFLIYQYLHLASQIYELDNYWLPYQYFSDILFKK